MPFRWNAGLNGIYDDNVASTSINKESSFALNPSLGLSVTRTTPQTVIDVNGRLGVIYYPDAPVIGGEPIDDLNNQSRLGLSISHRLSERLRFTSLNMASREREPDYSYGIATGRSGGTKGEYISLTTDNSLGYRWSERFGSTSGLKLWQTTSPNATTEDSDRSNWELHNQLRYQYSPQSVITGDYRFAKSYGSGTGQNATDHYLLAGDEYRFSPNTIGIVKAGVQFHEITNGDSSTSPYLELSGNSKMNKELTLKTFIRYSIENEGLNRVINGNLVNFSDHKTLRVGGTAEYAISPMFSILGGIDYIPATFTGAQGDDKADLSDRDECLFNTFVSLSIKFNEFLTGVASYTFADNQSDFGQGATSGDYQRNRISIGLNANF